MNRYKSLLALAIAAPLLAFRTGPMASNHWALIVGVSDYTNFEGVQGGDLPGAERDASAMRDVLVARWGFPNENVHMLLNGEASRAAIEQQITGWLGANAQPGDQVVVFFAGHGSQVWDQNGDEDDGLDETIAPADVLRDSPANDITDDVLGEWLRALPTRNVVYIHDNCNAGTGTRSATPFSEARKLPRDVERLSGPRPSRRAVGDVEDLSGFDISSQDVLELAAAQPDQAAVDAFFPGSDGAEPFHGGAFTTFLVQQLWRAPATATYEDVFKSVRETLRVNRFQQDPHISAGVALGSQALFSLAGAKGPAAAAFVPVVSVAGETAQIGAGQALGITNGSVLEADGGARLLVESVTRDRASVRILKGAVAAGARARLVGYRHAPSPLRVNVAGIDTETASAVRRELAQGNEITLVAEESGYADLFLRRRGTETHVYGLDGFSRKSFPTGSASTAALVAALRGEAAARRLGEMENLGQTFGVKLWLDGNKPGFGLGELIRIHASSERAGYLTVVDLGTDDKVTVLFPNTFHKDNRIGPNAEFTFPTADMGFDIEAQPPAGRGMVRAFVTLDPLDLPTDPDGFVTGDVLLADRIAAAVRKAAGAAEGSPEAIRLDTWGTASLVYDITR